jgi:hypothetical protein
MDKPIPTDTATGTTEFPVTQAGGAPAPVFVRLEDQIELALVYFEDGAPRSAARVLRQLADHLDRLAGERDTALAALRSEVL